MAINGNPDLNNNEQIDEQMNEQVSDGLNQYSAEQELEDASARAFAAGPMLFADSFVHGIGHSDAYIAFYARGNPVGVINMSLPSAKTLALGLADMLRAYEEQTGAAVPTIEEIVANAG